MKRTRLSLIAAFAACVAMAPAAFFGPQDHGGGDFILADGDVIWGAQTGIASFVIPAGATVTVRTYEGPGSGYGEVRVEATSITIDGTLNASGCGYAGGPGGGGGGAAQPFGKTVLVFPGGDAGVPIYTRPGLAPAGSGEFSTSTPNGPPPNPPTPVGGVGGVGGQGDSNVTPVAATVDATYSGLNDSVPPFHMGAGGGGGRGDTGDNFFAGVGGFGGAAGGSGGGRVTLASSETLTVSATGKILARGTLGGNSISTPISNGAPGATPMPAESGVASHSGGAGGAGAGGCIFLAAAQSGGMVFASGAVISTLNGRATTTGGGLVALVYAGSSPIVSGVTADGGRVVHNLAAATSGKWAAYE